MAVLHFCLFDDSLSLHKYRDGVKLFVNSTTFLASAYSPSLPW